MTSPKKKEKDKFDSINVICTGGTAVAKKSHNDFAKYWMPLYDSICWTRNLVSEPSNMLTPLAYKDEIIRELNLFGVSVEVLDADKMIELGMHALLNVARGSNRSPFTVIAKWSGGKSEDKPVVFAGKGVTFDTGGISIKPANGMEEMKYDMAGSAAAVGAIRALASRKAPVNAIAIVGIVENMPSGNAQNPGDIVVSMSGQTIEVINTDAEGRLVLADILSYAQKHLDPLLIIDLATLTGAVTVALGDMYAGLMSNNALLIDQIVNASNTSNEWVWNLPLPDEYNAYIDSKIADVQNVSNVKGAGTITAGMFLKRFIDKDMPWAHLDIASVAWTKKARDIYPEGATGFGVQLLNTFSQLYFENQQK